MRVSGDSGSCECIISLVYLTLLDVKYFLLPDTSVDERSLVHFWLLSLFGLGEIWTVQVR
ncbi:hypothetical protein B0T22DRAFT_446209 [Podospora appendiculata]|uniref:Uncharacterized protein n=1 Tax=Podospora appendiculata TaxID=314037 RepID=A0AAE0XEL0_9PEZI|nr:hypothetical protein B0T22DRAFT_446209 [Podospora appendiculata]